MTARADRYLLRHWLATLADTPGEVVASTAPHFGGTVVDLSDLDRAVDHAARQAERTDYYLRATTVRGTPAPGKRGEAADTLAVYGLWADLDHAQGVHKTNPNGRPLPPDRDAALTILDGLPEPTVIVDSSGGLQPWWLLDRPATVDDHDDLQRLVAAWGEMMVERGADLGWHVDKVGDLSRILRPPGTVNHKWTRRGEPARKVTILDNPAGTRYRLDQLTAHLPAPQPEPAPTPAPAPRGDHDDLGRWEADTDWAAILTPAGWTLHRTLDSGERWWTRPGDADNPKSAVTDRPGAPDTLVVHSGNAAPLPNGPGHKLTKLRTYALLHHDGDMSAAGRTIAGTTAPPDVSVLEPDQPPPDRAVGGGSFLLDLPEGIPAVWGEGTSVLWPQGEPLYIAGGVGTGKTTLGGQVAFARVGIGPGRVLGLPVEDDGGRLLYLAMDRPAQIARALARMVTDADRATLDRRVTFWRGPLPFYLPDNTDQLVALARKYDATTIVVDSVKDLGQVEKPEVGWAVNAAFQACVAEGIQVAAWHHQRKASGDNKKPTTLSDVYGSHALTAGAGSVVLLWGAPGDPVVELTHLKPAADVLGPWQLTHDHDAGRTTVDTPPDPLAILAAAPAGMTARNLAQKLTGKANPSASDTEKARRHLARLVKIGAASKREGDKSAQRAALYLPAAGGAV